MKKAIPMTISLILVATALVASLGKGRPVQTKAKFEISAVGDFGFCPSPSWFEAYDDGWQGNSRNRVDWCSGYIRGENSEKTDFLNPILEVYDGTFNHIEIQSFNRVAKIPRFLLAYKGPHERLYCVVTHSGQNEPYGSVESMTYDPTTAYGRWTVTIKDAPFYDITSGSVFLGRISATFVVTRVRKGT